MHLNAQLKLDQNLYSSGINGDCGAQTISLLWMLQRPYDSNNSVANIVY